MQHQYTNKCAHTHTHTSLHACIPWLSAFIHATVVLTLELCMYVCTFTRVFIPFDVCMCVCVCVRVCLVIFTMQETVSHAVIMKYRCSYFNILPSEYTHTQMPTYMHTYLRSHITLMHTYIHIAHTCVSRRFNNLLHLFLKRLCKMILLSCSNLIYI